MGVGADTALFLGLGMGPVADIELHRREANRRQQRRETASRNATPRPHPHKTGLR